MKARVLGWSWTAELQPSGECQAPNTTSPSPSPAVSKAAAAAEEQEEEEPTGDGDDDMEPAQAAAGQEEDEEDDEAERMVSCGVPLGYQDPNTRRQLLDRCIPGRCPGMGSLAAMLSYPGCSLMHPLPSILPLARCPCLPLPPLHPHLLPPPPAGL